MLKKCLYLILLASPLYSQAPRDLHARVSTAHHATLYYQSPACTTSSPCSLAVYRIACKTPTSCPAYGNGKGWTRLIAGAGTSNPSATGTMWIVQDTDSALQDSTTYAYVATLTWMNPPTKTSTPGPVWIGTTTGSSGGSSPAAPTVGAGNIVN